MTSDLITRLSKLDGPSRAKREKLNDILRKNVEAGHKAVCDFWKSYEAEQQAILRAKEASRGQ